MIVCSCNVISKSEIESVVYGFLEQDPWQLITVGMVYHAMAQRGKCCGCFPNAIAIIVEAVEKWHRRRGLADSNLDSHVEKLRETLRQHEEQRHQIRKEKQNRTTRAA